MLVPSPECLEQASCSAPVRHHSLLQAAKSQAQEENKQVGAGLKLSHKDWRESEGRWLAHWFCEQTAEGKSLPAFPADKAPAGQVIFGDLGVSLKLAFYC